MQVQMKEGDTLLKVDNNSAIQLAKNETHHGRTKHIEVHHHFIREKVERVFLVVEYCPTEELVADVQTKGLSMEKHEYPPSCCVSTPCQHGYHLSENVNTENTL